MFLPTKWYRALLTGAGYFLKYDVELFVALLDGNSRNEHYN